MFAARPVPQKNIDRIVELVSNLEKVSDVREIIELTTVK
jgi:hypothetical protein